MQWLMFLFRLGVVCSITLPKEDALTLKLVENTNSLLPFGLILSSIERKLLK